VNEDIFRRLSRLSPEAQELFWEVMRQGEEADFTVPPDELVVDLHQRMTSLPRSDQPEFVALFRDMAHEHHEEGLRLEAEALQFEGFAKLIERAQDLDRRAGRPVNEHMTLAEAIPKLEAAGELSVLEREYVEAAKDEVVWVPVEEDDED
jgi:hypothetical protein